MPVILCNAFSINMLKKEECHFRFFPLTDMDMGVLAERLAEATQEGTLVNAIGHPDTDRIVRSTLGEVGTSLPPAQRISVTVGRNTVLFVAQYSGPRLPEGATVLPEGARIDWWQVTSD